MGYYTPPREFTSRLHREFNDRIRVRWSHQRQAWQVEARVARAVDLPITDDDSQRLRDGYTLICEVRPGTRMPCPACGLSLRVPAFEFREVACPWCQRKRRDGRHVAGYFPLGDALIEHLKKLDPLRDHRRQVVAEMDMRNRRRKRQQELDTLSDIDAVTRDHFNPLHQIPQFGYTGKTGMWLSE